MKMKAWLCTLLLFGFLLGVHEGKVALFRDGSTKPMKVFPYDISMLPEADQKRLKDGVYADSLNELRKIVQDYLS